MRAAWPALVHTRGVAAPEVRRVACTPGIQPLPAVTSCWSCRASASSLRHWRQCDRLHRATPLSRWFQMRMTAALKLLEASRAVRAASLQPQGRLLGAAGHARGLCEAELQRLPGPQPPPCQRPAGSGGRRCGGMGPPPYGYLDPLRPYLGLPSDMPNLWAPMQPAQQASREELWDSVSTEVTCRPCAWSKARMRPLWGPGQCSQQVLHARSPSSSFFWDCSARSTTLKPAGLSPT